MLANFIFWPLGYGFNRDALKQPFSIELIESLIGMICKPWKLHKNTILRHLNDKGLA